MNHFSLLFQGGSARTKGFQFCLLLSIFIGALLALAETRAATFTLRYDQMGNQTSQQTAVTAASPSSPNREIKDAAERHR